MSSRSQLWNAKDLSFSVEPQVAFFNASGGKSEHTMTNMSEKRLAVKIRCSNNQLYRVSPVCYFIEPGQSQNVTVTRLNGLARTDKLVVMFTEATATDTDVKTLFGKCTKSKIDTTRIQLKMNDEGKSDSKKDIPM